MTTSDSDASPVNVGRVLDLAALGMPINPAARAGDSAIAGERLLPPGKVPTTRALDEAAEIERLEALKNPAAWDSHFQRASGNEAAAERSRWIAKEFHEASTAANPGKAIRDKAGALLRDDDSLLRLSQEEIIQLKHIAKGTFGKMSGTVAKMLGADGAPGVMSFWRTAGGAAGGTAGFAIDGPVAAGAGMIIGQGVAPLGGRALRAAENASSRHRLRVLEEMPRKDSPHYRDLQRLTPLQSGNAVTDLYRQGLLGVSIQGLAGAATRSARDDDQ